jgi:predicted nucleic acid-binding protein
MILLDTNVLIYASTEGSPFLDWARRVTLLTP